MNANRHTTEKHRVKPDVNPAAPDPSAAVRKAGFLLPVLRRSAESWGNHHCAGELRRAIELIEDLSAPAAAVGGVGNAVGYVMQDGTVTFYIDDFVHSRKPAPGTQLYTSEQSAAPVGGFVVSGAEHSAFVRGYMASAMIHASSSLQVEQLERFAARAAEKQGFAASPTAQSSRESRMIVVERDANDRPTVWCDPEIVDLVTALNNAEIATVASCSGHGEKWGNIALKDGRELFIAPDFSSARKFDAQSSAKDGVRVDAFPNWNEHLRENNALDYQHDFRLFKVVESYAVKAAEATTAAGLVDGVSDDYARAVAEQYGMAIYGMQEYTPGPLQINSMKRALETMRDKEHGNG